jgi:membrane protease YdiL (CAAX protease family)
MVVIGSAGVLQPGRWRGLRAMAWLVVLCVGMVIVFNAAAKVTLALSTWSAGLELASPSAAPSTFKLVAAIVGSIVLILAYWAAVRLAERRAVAELALRPAPAELLGGLAIGGALMAAIVGILWAFGWAILEARAVDRIALALRDSIRSGVLEEVVLRLAIFRMLWRAFGIWPALVGAAVVFGALHLGNPDSSLFAAACLIAGEGIGIGLYLITGRIWASIGMHAGWNFAQGWLFGAAVSGTTDIAGGPLVLRPMPGVAEALSGGGFGPEASAAALVVSLAASAALLWRAWRLGAFVAADAREAIGC